MTDLDPKLTFDSFVVGPANRLASAAARRAAESPGASYNPLFVYSASGLGKSHILNAIAHHAVKGPGSATDVSYMTLENYLEELAEALQRGERDTFRDRFGSKDILLLDDVQFLAGQPEAQEMLLRTLDQLTGSGSQIVLASDRPPAEIDGLDARLLSRFAGGLIVDIAPPEFETRVAIIRKKAASRGQELDSGVAESIARYPFRNVRELGGALNKVFATQDLEGRQVTAEEVPALVGQGEAVPQDGPDDEYGTFLQDVTVSLAETVEAQEEPWRKAFREAVDAAEREGFVTARLKAHQSGDEPDDWETVLREFRDDVQRLREIDEELERLQNPWPEAAEGLLKDPDRLDEAEALLTSVAERQRPFPRLGPGKTLEELTDFARIAVRGAQQLVTAEKPEYNPLYVWSGTPELARTLLGATGRSYQTLNPGSRMAVTSVKEFAQDFIRALGQGVAGAWRERWWTVDLLLVHGIQDLSETERAQDEFFHLFEALKRRGARVLLAADRPPSGVAGIDERLRSRFEGGLVLEVEQGSRSDDLTLVESGAAEEAPASTGAAQPLWDEPAGPAPAAQEAPEPAPSRPTPPAPEPEPATPATPPARSEDRPAPAAKPAPAPGGGWFPSRENVVLQWPELERLIVEELE